MKIFNLPDLGEGLAEAEIVQWLVKAGDEIAADDPLVAVETDKAIVEIPSPRDGRIRRLCANEGDIVQTGGPLLEYAAEEETKREDSGTVVGKVVSSEQKLQEKASPVSRKDGSTVKAMPAVRALARQLEVDISVVSPSGPGESISADDVKRVAKRLQELGPLELLRGARRTMAAKMTQSGAEVVPATIVDNADIDHWPEQSDVTAQIIMAIVAACAKEPNLNAWFDAHSIGRRVLEQIDIAIAADTSEGLFTPVIRDAASCDYQGLTSQLQELRANIKQRSIAAQQMRDYTITVSNFGMIAGRYATPIVVPPTVAIIGAGRIEAQAVIVGDEVVAHRLLPLSLTFDHRAVTGGEAARFMAAMIESLETADIR